MTPERWQQINQLYQSALELEASGRTEFLNQASAGDEELRQEVESLLASHEQAKSFIETPALEVAAQVIAEKQQAQSMVGREIGSYKVLALLGKGGMGEVYRAKDTRLGREVAVKILPAAFTSDADRLHRFEQEARAAGRLNHPNVLAVYDVGTYEGSPYIVSELLEGETLRDRMKGTALPPRRAMEYGLQIARGLAAAHEKGIVHRDLKPENIFVTKDGRLKILDFGLAKLLPQLNTAVDSDLSTQMLKTGPGIVMGTMGYMSPEQVRGEAADHRSDLFTFGAILYEMLSGQRAFQGKSAIESMSAILKEEPPELSKTNPDIPPGLEHIVRRCVEKTPEQRFQAASDLAFGLEEISGSTSAFVAPVVGQQRSRERLGWVVSIFLVLVFLALAALYFHPTPAETAITRFIVPPPEKAAFAPQSIVALSPNGRLLAFVATAEGKRFLWVRPLDSLSPRLLPGTEGGGGPFWSPDSRFIGFFAQGKLKKIEISGGPALALCDVDSEGVGGGTWNRDGVILFSPTYSDALYRVSASGGTATRTTTLDPSRGELFLRWPQFLPDGRHFVYFAGGSRPEKGGINVASLDSKETKRILNVDSNVVYAPPGYLLFLREGTLLAQPFDAKRFEIMGDPVSVAEHVRDWSFSASHNNELAYESGMMKRQSQLIWFDRGGKQLESVGEPGEYWHLELSPDDRRVVVEKVDANNRNIWTIDLLHGIPMRFTFSPDADIQPTWSPDGSHIVYTSYQGGGAQIYQRMSNGAGNPEVLLKEEAAVSDWSRDGRFILYESKSGLSVLPLFGDHKPFPLLQTGESRTILSQWALDGLLLRGVRKGTSICSVLSSLRRQVADLNQWRLKPEMAGRWERVILSGGRSEADGGGSEWRKYFSTWCAQGSLPNTSGCWPLPLCRHSRWPTLSCQYPAGRRQHRANHCRAQLDRRSWAKSERSPRHLGI